MNFPKISVCMATYNGERYVAVQLTSILNQLSDGDELIISDDSSIDNTTTIIKSFNDNRIKLYENQQFKSPIFNFENALKHANGEYIFLADQDDIWIPRKVEIFKKYLNDYDLVLSDANIIDDSGKEIYESFYRVNASNGGLLKNMVKNSYLGCTMAFNRKILEKSLPFPKDLPMHDWWMGLIAEVYGKTCFVDDKLISYRRHGNNASPTGEKSKYSIIKKIQFRLIMCKNLFMKAIA